MNAERTYRGSAVLVTAVGLLAVAAPTQASAAGRGVVDGRAERSVQSVLDRLPKPVLDFLRESRDTADANGWQ